MLSSKQANYVLVFIIIFCLIKGLSVLFGLNIFDASFSPEILCYANLFMVLTYGLIALQSFISLRRRSLRKWIMPGITAFFVGLLVIEVIVGLQQKGLNLSIRNLAGLLTPVIALIFIWLPSKTKRVSQAKEQGTVKWFHQKKGYGFIKRPEGDDLFVHYRGIDSTNKEQGHRVLREGQRVAYYVEKGVRGLQAKDVSILN